MELPPASPRGGSLLVLAGRRRRSPATSRTTSESRARSRNVQAVIQETDIRKPFGICALTLVPGVIGGSETYVRELLKALNFVGERQLHVFLPTIATDAHGGLPHTSVSTYPASFVARARMRAMVQTLALGNAVRKEIRPERLAGIHYPLSTPIPRITSIPSATTIVDVQHLIHPKFFSRPERAYRRLAYGLALRNCDRVITISQHAADAIIETTGLNADKVRVIHLGVDVERFATKHVLPRENFLLYPANRWPHKNHDRLFQAFEQIRTIHPDITLVLTGAGHDSHPAPCGVRVVGHVSNDELAHLYQTARAMVFPSLYEGFGLPPLEAMAAGCPIAVSNAASIPEICGDAANYFDPTNVNEMADVILETIAQPEKLLDKGRQRALLFTWRTCAEQHLALYAELEAMPMGT